MRYGLFFSATRLLRIGGALLALAAAAGACAVKEIPPEPSATAPASAVIAEAARPPAQAPGLISRETGTAGWYGRDLHGRKTASGELFNMNASSAAHRTLPLGTIIRVVNLDNSKSITTAITDRGPFVRSRVLDLSYGAARELGFLSQGTARVRIETLERPGGPAVYTVQAANYNEEESARLLKERLAKRFEAVSIVLYETNLARYYRVRVGAYASEEVAEKVAAKLTLEGLEPIVIRKD